MGFRFGFVWCLRVLLVLVFVGFCGFLGLRCIRDVRCFAVFGVFPCVVCFSCRLGVGALVCGWMCVGVIRVFWFVVWCLCLDRCMCFGFGWYDFGF